jgi:hypothetical protein
MIKKIVFFYFIYIIFEGALRKWALPSFSVEFFLLKDLILVLGIMVYFTPGGGLADVNRKYLHASDVLIWAGWTFLFTAILAISGISLSSLASYRYFIAALPILFLVPVSISSYEGLSKVVRLHLLIAIAVCILGVIQYLSPVDSPLNVYAWRTKDAPDIATFGDFESADPSGFTVGRARITGTFSYISPYAIYLQFMYLAVWGLLLCSKQLRTRVIASVGLVLIFINIAMTGARANILICAILTVPFAFTFLTSVSSRLGKHRVYLITLSIVIVGAFLYLAANPFTALESRASQAGDTESRIAGSLLMPLTSIADLDLLGAGLGAAFGGISELSVDERTITRTLVELQEIQHDRIALEAGTLAYVFVLFVKIYYMINTFRLAQSAVHFETRVWALVSFCYQLGLVWQVPVFNATASAYYFLCIALYYWLRSTNDSLLQQRQRVQSAIDTAPDRLVPQRHGFQPYK